MDPEVFRVRLNCVDHYQSAPNDYDPELFGRHGSTQRADAPQVPVIRVFGSTETGQKVCAHIHGALPYLYLEYHGSLHPTSLSTYVGQLQTSINHALATSYRRHAYDDGNQNFVAKITFVKGTPFFGYHVGYQAFTKVYMLNPLDMTRLADLLHQGAVLDQVFQPYESHLQYILQWMCDFNLYGCSYIDCSLSKFRYPVPLYEELQSTQHRWHTKSITPDRILDPERFPRQSQCSIEVDIRVEDILNRLDLKARDIHHDFMEHFTPESADQKLVQSLAGLWRDETKRRKRTMGATNPSSSPFSVDVLKSMSAGSRNLERGGWVHEQEYTQLMNLLIQEEHNQKGQPTLSFNASHSPRSQPLPFRTVFESVKDLFQVPMRSPPQMIRQTVQVEAIVHHAQQRNNPCSDRSRRRPVRNLSQEYKTPSQTSSELGPILQGRVVVPTGRKDIAGVDETQPMEITKTALASHTNGSPIVKERQHQRLSPAHVRSRIHKAPELSSLRKSTTLAKLRKGRYLPRGVKSNKFSDARSAMVIEIHDQKSELKSPRHTLYSLCISQDGSEHKRLPHSGRGASTGSLSLGRDDQAFYSCLSGVCPTYKLHNKPPPAKDIITSLRDHGLVEVIHQDPYYSDEKDVPSKSRDYAGREYRLGSASVVHIPAFDWMSCTTKLKDSSREIAERPLDSDRDTNQMVTKCSLQVWEYAVSPPAKSSLRDWRARPLMRTSHVAKKPDSREIPAAAQLGQQTQIADPTQKENHRVKFRRRQPATSVRHETQYMSTMSLEVHVNTRDSLVPDPEKDGVSCIFWCLKSDDEIGRQDEVLSLGSRLGMIVLADRPDFEKSMVRETDVEIMCEQTELDILNRIVDIVRELDPDILTGYEVHNGSWGYLIERARLKYEFDLCEEFSRTMSKSHGRFGKEADRWGFNHTSTIRVTGRHMINVWRAMRSELNLLQHTIENVAFHLLQKRIPHYSYQTLTKWYKSGTMRDVAKVHQYLQTRACIDIEILEASELIPRTSEQARLIGVDFYSVFSRGSQFKVESFMFRIAKPENFLLVSPSRKQVGQQNALECLPLVMEPQSNFYSSPVLVLDFQSLYPSIMIAYNYCYSTCLGRIVGWRGRNKLGFTDFKREQGIVELVKDYINIAPNGMMYVKPEMRKSLLAKMLGEILETRIMVKSGMKADKDDKTLQKLLNNRQLALKLLANVTYGYTSASFSGRMPCSEIADSIVQTARETLEKAIALIHSIKRWDAEVVYGDTDSLFVHLKGRSKEQAFEIGHEIIKAVTDLNPQPMKLKFEKVYFPCVLLAKKRYVGFKYESKLQEIPEFEAKGIETVRRDGTPAEQKIEEKALKILFRTADLSQVKRYFQEQCGKLMQGQVSVQDFCFAKEVKLGTYAEKGLPPPGALISSKRMLEDPRTEPQYGERVPYVVKTGAPSARLIDRCIAPEQLLGDEDVHLDAEYYISKNIIPPLERIFNLVGANVRQWYDEMPKVQHVREHGESTGSTDGKRLHSDFTTGVLRRTLERYMQSSNCIVCRNKLSVGQEPGPTEHEDELQDVIPICLNCRSSPAASTLRLSMKVRETQCRVANVYAVCRHCSGLSWNEDVRCDSHDCPMYFSRLRTEAAVRKSQRLLEAASHVIDEGVSGDE